MACCTAAGCASQQASSKPPCEDMQVGILIFNMAFLLPAANRWQKESVVPRLKQLQEYVCVPHLVPL